MASRDGVHFERWNEAFLRPGPERPETWLYGHQYIAWHAVETKAALVADGDDESRQVVVFARSHGNPHGGLNPRSLSARYCLRLACDSAAEKTAQHLAERLTPPEANWWERKPSTGAETRIYRRPCCLDQKLLSIRVLANQWGKAGLNSGPETSWGENRMEHQVWEEVFAHMSSDVERRSSTEWGERLPPIRVKEWYR